MELHRGHQPSTHPRGIRDTRRGSRPALLAVAMRRVHLILANVLPVVAGCHPLGLLLAGLLLVATQPVTQLVAPDQVLTHLA